MEEVVRGFNTIIDHGHAHYWGTSEWSAFEIEHAMHIADKLGLIGTFLLRIELIAGPCVEQPQYY